MDVLKLSECVFTGMLFGVDFDAVGAHGKKARLVFAEIDDELFGVEGAVSWFHIRIQFWMEKEIIIEKFL